MLKRFMAIVGFALILSAVHVDLGQDSDSLQIKITDVQVVYEINGDIVNATYQANYDAQAFDMADGLRFGWLIPLPAEPIASDEGELVASSEAIWARFTDYENTIWDNDRVMDFTLPNRYCDDLYWAAMNTSQGSGYYETEFAEVADYQIMDAEAVADWLSADVFPIQAYAPDQLDNALAAYNTFILVEFEPEYDYGGISPFTISYPLSDPSVSLPTLALANSENFILWVVAHDPSQRFVAANYPAVEIDLTRLSGVSRLLYPYYLRVESYSGTNYGALRRQALEGGGVVTDAAVDRGGDDGYLTRFYGKWDVTNFPTQAELIFAPDATAAEISTRINVADYVDPLKFWGCTNQYTGAEALEQSRTTLTGRTELLGLDFIHPPDWVQTELEISGANLPTGTPVTLYIFAPRTVTWDDVQAYMQHTPTVSMLVAYQSQLLNDADGIFSPRAEDILGGYSAATIRERFVPEAFNRSGVNLIALPADDGAGNTVRVMLEYADNLLYYTSAELPFSVFLGDVTVGYPEDWSAKVVDEITGEIVIEPKDTSQSARVQILPANSLLGLAPTDSLFLDATSLTQLVQVLSDRFGVEVTDFTPTEVCPGVFKRISIPYKQGEHTGVAQIIHSMQPYLPYVVITSAATDQYSNYQVLFETIQSTIRDSIVACG